MTLADLNKPAELTLWSSRAPAHTAQGHRFPTLRAALAAATEASHQLRYGKVRLACMYITTVTRPGD